jgi:hypothetical protein
MQDSRRRFAIRLANQLGYLDPDAMLDQMSPEQFDERIAHEIVEPWGEPWKVGGTIAATIVNAIAQYIAVRAGQNLPPTALADPDDFVPRPSWFERDSKRRVLSDEESERQMMRLV